jgi:hypothetical protein
LTSSVENKKEASYITDENRDASQKSPIFHSVGGNESF